MAGGGNEDVVSLLRVTNAPLTKEELLSSIPSKVITDMLIARFFEHVSYMMRTSTFIIMLVIGSNSHRVAVAHESTFRQEVSNPQNLLH